MPEVIINGPEGRIEGRYHHCKTPNAPIALLLHPHPQHGGTMNNKVVYSLYHAFVRRGFSALRFNFRGVGRSQGNFDRGEGELSDALKPTKVKGQFTPGGQMPSITLKGVSLKGESKVAYEEAAAAAQSEAQSALSQEKVPRAYQGAVKDYFDDLKK